MAVEETEVRTEDWAIGGTESRRGDKGVLRKQRAIERMQGHRVSRGP
jgi:hypothetical protein